MSEISQDQESLPYENPSIGDDSDDQKHREQVENKYHEEKQKEEQLSEQEEQQKEPQEPEEEEEEDYDPEVAYDPDSTHEQTSGQVNDGHEPKQDSDNDDYNPEASVEAVYEPPSTKTSGPPSIPAKPPVGLPPKPAVGGSSTFTRDNYRSNRNSNNHLQNHQDVLKQAYEAIMDSEVIKDPNFTSLPQVEQMKIIMSQLEQKNIKLNTGTNYSSVTNMNYDQVYSYNKPSKNLRDPIPLIPVNELCRRPNITAPMSPEEEAAYDEFIKREADYMRTQNWDEFPDKLRLFIGNLPANTISKQDLFRIFSQYGEVIQIAIKAGYGFAQFRTAEACLDCIKGETNVPLHNKIMRLDASKPQKVKRDNGGRGDRDRGGNVDGGNKRRRRNIADCQIYTTGKSSVFFVRKVKRCIQDAQVTSEIEDVTHRELSEVIGEAAYSGVVGTCVIKEQKCDVQTFESTPDGGIKFDEYSDIEPEVAAEILQKAKMKKYGGQIPPYQRSQYDSQYGGNDSFGNPTAYGGSSYVPGQSSGHDGYGSSSDGYGGDSRRMGRDRNARGRGRRRNETDRSSYVGRGANSSTMPYARGYNNLSTSQMYGSPPQAYSGQPGYSQAGYNNNLYSSYSNQYGQPAAPNFPTQQEFNSPQPPLTQVPPQQQQIPGNDQAGLLLALQNMDPASMQNVISLLQQQQQPQASPQTTSGNNASVNKKRSYNQPIDYGSASSQFSSGGPNSQVSSLLSQLQSQANSQSQLSQQQSQQNEQDSSSTQSLMDTLARLSRK